MEALNKFGFPLSEEARRDPNLVKNHFKLSDTEVSQIEAPIIAEKERERQQQEEEERKREQAAAEDYANKLQQYQQRFAKAIEAEYPLSQAVADGLKNFQQQLELKNEDITRIEQPIREPAEAKYQEKLKQQAEAEQQRQIELEQQRRFEFDVITVDKKGNENNRTRKTAEIFAEDLGNGVLLEMVKIPSGTFQMGSPVGQGSDNEKPQHEVTISAFLMGKYPITQAQWRVVAALPQVEIPLNAEPSNFKGDSRPVEQVSWDEAVEFCQRLSRATGHSYRLPSEAEWEYACRAGTTTEFYFGETLTPNLARCKANLGIALVTLFGGETAPVGSYLPNGFGLYDMHGNVWEWCADYWHDDYTGAPTDGTAWVVGGNSERRVIRGGSWDYLPASCRAAYRHFFSPASRYFIVGFRVVCAVLPGLF